MTDKQIDDFVSESKLDNLSLINILSNIEKG